MKLILDTDHVSLLEVDDPRVTAQLALHAVGDVAVTVITVEESLVGWLSSLNKTGDKAKREAIYRRMAKSVMLFSGFAILPYTMPAMDRFDELLKQRTNVRSNDLRIAAIALELGATVVTRNLRDFGRIPGLSLANWAA